MLASSEMNTRQFVSIVKAVAYKSTSVKGEEENALLIVDGPACIRSSRFSDKAAMNRKALAEAKKAQWVFWIVPEQWYILSVRKSQATGQDEIYWAKFDPADYIEGNHVSRAAAPVRVPSEPARMPITPPAGTAKRTSVVKFF